MLAAVGAGTLDQLMDEALPDNIREPAPLVIGDGVSEREALARMRQIANRNEVFTSLIGQGYSDTILPPVILRNILENPAWYTAYTPYQPEISQGRLEALLNFQTMIADLTGLDIANASLLDEATAAAEAMAMAQRNCRHQRAAFFVDDRVHPQTLAVLKTRAEPLGWEIVSGDPEHGPFPGRRVRRPVPVSRYAGCDPRSASSDRRGQGGGRHGNRCVRPARPDAAHTARRTWR